MDDFISQTKSRQEVPRKPERRHWLRRILVGVVVLLAIGAGVFFWIVQKTRTNPPYSTALALIQSDVQLVEQLGEPIRDLRWLPTSGYPKQFQMQLALQTQPEPASPAAPPVSPPAAEPSQTGVPAEPAAEAAPAP